MTEQLQLELAGEEWRPVVGYEGRYEVSNLGRVRSYLQNRHGGEPWVISSSPRIMSAKPASRGGYPMLSLCGGHGPTIPIPVHRLVMQAFGPPPPFPGAVVRHLDDTKTNNRVGNLAWGTEKENGQDKARNGRAIRGEANKKSKLTEADVIEIRRLAAAGVSQYMIAARFGVTRPAIGYVVRRATWRHVA